MKKVLKNTFRFQAIFSLNLMFFLLATWNFNLNAQSICPAAESVSVGSVSATSAKILYHLSPNVSSAAIEYRTGNSDWTSVTISKNATYVELPNLTPSTKYTFIIRSLCENSTISITPAYTSPKEFTTYPIATCPAADNVSVGSVSATAAKIIYHLSPNVSSAAIEYKSEISGWKTVVISKTATYIELPNLSPSTKYSFRIKSLCEGNTISITPVYTDIKEFVTYPLAACPAAENVSVGTITANSAIINYNLSMNVFSAAIEYKTSSSDWKTIQISKTAHLWDIKDLAPSTTYIYRIKSECVSNTISNTIVYTTPKEFTTYPSTCPAATNLSVSEITATSAMIKYTLSPNIGNATLEVSSAINPTWRIINLEVKSTSFLLKELTPSTKYKYRIKTACPNIPADISTRYAEGSFETLALTVCTAASKLSAREITSVSAIIYYSLPAELSSAYLDIHPAGSPVLAPIVLSPSSSSILSNELKPQTTYEYRIKTICKNGAYTYSAVASFTTLASSGCAPATNLAVISTGTTGAKISYKLPTETGSSAIEIISANSTTASGSNEAWQSFPLANYPNSYEFSKLTPATKYYSRIKTTCQNGSFVYSTAVYFTTLGIPNCSAATGLSAAVVIASSVRINFALHGEVKSAALQIRPESSKDYLTYNIPVPSASIDRNELKAMTKYFYKIKTICYDGTVLYSDEASFTTPAASTCASATNLSAVNISASGAKIGFTLPKEIIGASLEIIAVNTDTPAGSTSVWKSIPLYNTTSPFELTGLSPKTLYYFRIKTECAGNAYIYSDVSKFTTLAVNTCTGATNVSVGYIAPNSAKVGYTLPKEVTKATIELIWSNTTTQAGSGSSRMIDITPGSSYTVLNDLTPSTRYYVRIIVACPQGAINSDPIGFTTLAASDCYAATNVTASYITVSSAKITYTLPKNISSAELEIYSSNYPNWKPISVSPTSSGYELRELYPGTKYGYRIKTICNNGISSDKPMYSTEGTFYTLSTTECGMATNVTHSIVSSTSAHIYFTLPKNISSAAVEIATSPNTAFWKSYGITSLNSAYYNLEGLTAGVRYYYRIKTVCAENPASIRTSYTPFGNFTTSNNKDAAAAGINPTTQSPGALTISCYPNPASSIVSLTITGVTGDMVELKISNIYGRAVFMGRFPENTVQKMDIQSYPRGIYVIRVSQSGKTNSIKVLFK